MEWLFFISATLIAWTYLGYVGVITLWGTLFPKRLERRYHTRPVSVVVAARDEEINIRARIDNLRAQEYPAELMEIIIVSDGSTDRTVEVAREFGGDRVRVISLESPEGKASALNAGVAAATGEIVVFADARQRFAANAVAELVSRFYHDRVGAVSGELMIEAAIDSEVHEGVGLYWRYEKLIRRMESVVDSVVGATGSIYAIRRSLYVPLETRALLDDVLVPMRVVLAGHRVLFERRALAYDVSSSTAAHEFRRKVRTLAGNFQAMVLEPRLLKPGRNRLFFQFISHKVCRLFVPYAFVAALVASASLGGVFYGTICWLQILLLILGLIHRSGSADSAVGRVGRISWTFTVMNAAAVMGLWVFLTRREKHVWRRESAQRS